MKKLKPPSQFLSAKRHYKFDRRAQKKRCVVSYHRYRKFEHIDYLALEGFQRAIPLGNPGASNFATRIDIQMPRVFSLLDAPIESLKILRRITKAGVTNGRCCEIVIDWAKTEIVDLACYLLITQLGRQIKRHRKNEGKNRRIKIRNINSSKASSNLRVDSTEYSKRFGNTFRDKFETIEKIDRTDTSVTKKDRATGNFCEHINECLRPSGYELTDVGEYRLGQIVGEVLDNSEEHVKHRNWVVGGSLVVSGSNHRCELVMYNFGISIAQSFRDLPKEHYTVSSVVMPYVKKHLRSSSARGLTEGDLITLAALQQRVSRKNREQSDHRGQGTVHLIEFFYRNLLPVTAKMEMPPPKMAIISGGTHLTFDGTYRLAENVHGRKLIAFNTENSLEKAPDRNYFTNISNCSFPGTAVCIEFSLNPGDVEELR